MVAGGQWTLELGGGLCTMVGGGKWIVGNGQWEVMGGVGGPGG